MVQLTPRRENYTNRTRHKCLDSLDISKRGVIFSPLSLMSWSKVRYEDQSMEEPEDVN